MPDISNSIEAVKQAWIESAYYQNAEKWTGAFWDPASDFRRLFERLDVTRCAELACGHGRHAEQLLRLKPQHVQMLYCLDVIQNNIDVTSRRLAPFPRVRCMLSNGKDFQPIATGELTAIYCYDAMVHFSPDIVESYLADAYRALRPGGRALLHHSNLDAPQTGQRPDSHYGRNPHARNHMTLALFSALAASAGLRILETRARQWGEIADLDRLSLLERP
jgi:SAM-dependent methyltransferase